MKKAILVLVLSLCFSWGLFSQTSSILGDANANGTIDIVDALVVAQFYVGLPTVYINTALADVNGDGSVSIVDALMIAQYYVGIITVFPAQTQTVEVLKSSTPRNTSPTLNTGELSQLVADNTAFAIDVYKKVSGTNDNVIFSPYSISVDLGMCYAGAKSTTDTEIANTMHFSLGQARLHNAFNALDLQLSQAGNVVSGSTGQQFTLRLANSIWGQKNFSFVQSFLDTLAINYNAGLNILDFGANPENCRVTINNWVSNQTEQKIKDLLSPGTITGNTLLVLTNAIYFKASWYVPFLPASTAPGAFTSLDGSTSTAQMMHQTQPTVGVEVTGQYQAVSLPYYGSRFSMVVILPEQGTFKSFESSLTADSLASIFSSLASREVTLTLPKFSFNWGQSLKTILQALGMNVPFSSGANFTGITTSSSLFISDVIHKAYIGIDEQGTEAAAATGTIMSGAMPNPLIMNINRPFIFAIRENASGTILFLGRVLKP